MDPRYIVNDFRHCLGHVVEECGEVCAAAGKTIRWGPESTNPNLPEDEQITNIAWLSKELLDLRSAIVNLERVIAEGRYAELEES